MRLPIVLLLAALLSSGCAGILHGTNDTVSVNSMEDDTIIYVDGTPRGRNTAIAQLKRGDAHTITASKEGCRNVTVETTQSFDTVAIGDFFRFRDPLDPDRFGQRRGVEDRSGHRDLEPHLPA